MPTRLRTKQLMGAIVLKFLPSALATPALLIVAASAFSTASAADYAVGASASLTRGRVDCIASMPCDRSDAGFKIYGGYRIAESADLRLTYFDGGRYKGGDKAPLGTEFGGDFKVSGIGLSAGYLWTFAPAWSLYAQAGVASVRTRFEYADPFSGNVSKTTTQPTAGLSLGYAVTPAVRFGLDYDVSRFKAHETRGSLQMLGVSVRYGF